MWSRKTSGYTGDFGRLGRRDPIVTPISDSPTQGGASAQYPNGDYFDRNTLNVSFQTYLIYRSPGGYWVALSEIDWGLSGTATFNNPNPAGQGTVDDYTNLANWTVVSSPNDAGTYNGSLGTSFVSWTNFYNPNFKLM